MTPDRTYGERVEEVDLTIERLEAQLAGAREFRDALAQRAAGEVVEALAREGIKRSQLTPMQKHQLIRKLGLEQYQALPWS